MEIQVPLNKLKFGHEALAGINARVSGRDDGIDALAANIFARGQIENLVVVKDENGFFAVSNGNRRLAAFRQIHGETGTELINCTLRDVDADGAFEDSLATAVLAQQLHPVDQYEAFARLDSMGRTHDEIASRYGLMPKQVRQALALGRLSPMVRDAWRSGVLNTEQAQAFTLAVDHAQQDEVFVELKDDGNLSQWRIRRALRGEASGDVNLLLGIVGADAYVAAGGSVTEDLFGDDHNISDEALLRKLADALLQTVCDDLIDEGWSWADVTDRLPVSYRGWGSRARLSDEWEIDDSERECLLALREKIGEAEELDDRDLIDLLEFELNQTEQKFERRSYSEAERASLGCIVSIETVGSTPVISISFAVQKPVADKPSDVVASSVPQPEVSVALPVPDVSNALAQRLNVQATLGIATALSQDAELASSVIIAALACNQSHGVRINASGLGSRTSQLLIAREFPAALAEAQQLGEKGRAELLAVIAAGALDFQSQPICDKSSIGARAICAALDAAAVNAGLRGAFEAADYFNSASKDACLAAIEEALGVDHARQQSKNNKQQIAAFAIENVQATGWLPVQLRTEGYDGPPSAKKAAPAGKAKPAAKKIAGKAVKVSAKKAAVAKAAKAKSVSKPAKKVAKKASKKRKG